MYGYANLAINRLTKQFNILQLAKMSQLYLKFFFFFTFH